MDCVNHSGVPAAAYCQNCGKPLCTQCVRRGPAGQILCEQDFAAWQAVPPVPPFAAPGGTPNPVLAAVLGIIPGVGAMYNGQFFKGLIHVVIFAVLISITDHFGIFGIFIAAWVLYQSFEAYHTARARRDGLPLPDPLGLNEVGNWLNMGPPNQPPHAGAGPGANPSANPFQAGMNPGVNPGPFQTGVNPGAESPNPAPGTGAWTPYQQVPYEPHPGFGVPPQPPIPPVPPPMWRRREPVGAVILIALGLLFLLNQLGYVTERILHYSWPLILIALGAWLIVRRVNDTKGGPQ